jgi:hypothetical protein
LNNHRQTAAALFGEAADFFAIADRKKTLCSEYK